MRRAITSANCTGRNVNTVRDVHRVKRANFDMWKRTESSVSLFFANRPSPSVNSFMIWHEHIFFHAHLRYDGLGKHPSVVRPFRAVDQCAVNIDVALVFGVRGGRLRAIILLVRRHEDDRQLVPGHRKFDQGNRQADGDLPFAEIADCCLHGVDICVTVDMVVFTIGNSFDVHARCNLKRCTFLSDTS